VILCDVAREDASVILSELRALEIDRYGSIAVEMIDTQLSQASADAEKAAVGAPGDAVVWEEVASKTSESATLTPGFMAFMVLATLITSVAIFLDSAVLLVGGMVVGPEFGPIAGFCVALVQRRPQLARASALAIVVGFPLSMAAALLASLLFKWTGVAPADFSEAHHDLSSSIANPDFFAFFVAFCAGAAGMLSLTTAKSGALVGVLVSVTTIPAASNVAVSAAYEQWDSASGSLQQLGLNIGGILLAGILTLSIQRRLYHRRLRRYRAATPSSPATPRPRSSSGSER
jgi:uncharacterized hydrophobic protein (TIGR00271 family)